MKNVFAVFSGQVAWVAVDSINRILPFLPVKFGSTSLGNKRDAKFRLSCVLCRGHLTVQPFGPLPLFYYQAFYRFLRSTK